MSLFEINRFLLFTSKKYENISVFEKYSPSTKHTFPYILGQNTPILTILLVMDNDDANNGIRCSHEPLRNINDETTTFVYETQPFTVYEQHAQKKKRRCHGNRKLQHFKRKCRARGLTDEQIGTLIQTRHGAISEQSPDEQATSVDHSRQATKRKRDRSQLSLLSDSVKSLSQLSLSGQKSTSRTTKKKKSSHMVNASSDNDTCESNNKIFTFYKSSKYLRMPKKLLLHSLRLQLNHSIKIEKEQSFILQRLQLLDHQFCLDQVRYLYQTFFDQGRKVQMWPVSITQSDRICV